MKTCRICESTVELAKTTDSGRKGITVSEQSTIEYRRIYKLIKSNLLSLIVGFDRIDGSHDENNRSSL